MPRPQVVGQPTSTKHFMAGINALADLLGATLGPVGGPVANQRDWQGKPELLDDSATTVRRILGLADPRADVGAMLIRSTVWRVVQRAGDGGAMAAVLFRAIYKEATRLVAAGANAMQLARGINLAVDAAVDALRAQSRPVRNENDLAAVALTVIQDRPLAAVLGEMSYLLGADAHVAVEKYVAQYLQQFYHPGVRYKAQIASMYLYTDPEQRRSVMPAGLVAIVDGNLEKVDDVVALLNAMVQSGGDTLTIVGNRFSDEVLGVLVANSRAGEEPKKTNGDDKQKQRKKYGLAAAQIKLVGAERRDALDDLAVMTGATVLGRDFTKPTARATVADLGRALRTEVDKDAIYVVPEHQHNPEVRERAAELRQQLAKMTLDDEDRPKLVARVSALSGGMGVLKIGAESKLDREVRAENAEKTLKVLSAAQHGGVAPGGGAAYIHAIPALDNLDVDGDVAMGVQVVARALAAPMRQILKNAHVPSENVIIDRVRTAGPTSTYDVFHEKVVDAFEGGVLDVSHVLTHVLQTAASGAIMALSTDVIVYRKKPEQVYKP